LIWIKTTSLAKGFHLLMGEWRKHLENVMTMLKSLTIVAVLLAGGASPAMAQNGLPTGNEPPVAGGAAGNPILDRSNGSVRPYTARHHRYYMTTRRHRQGY
jgi:hypothetical protein